MIFIIYGDIKIKLSWKNALFGNYAYFNMHMQTLNVCVTRHTSIFLKIEVKTMYICHKLLRKLKVDS